MNSVEEYFQKYFDYYKSQDYPTALIWGRKLVEEICTEVLISHGITVKPKDNLSTYLTKLTSEGWLPSSILLNIRILQNYGNFASHGSIDEIRKIDKNFLKNPTESLLYLIKWYRLEYKKRIPSNINVSVQQKYFNKFLTESSIRITLNTMLRRLELLFYFYPFFLLFSLPIFISRNLSYLIIMQDDNIYYTIDRRLAEYLRQEIDKRSYSKPFIISEKHLKMIKVYNPYLVGFYIGLENNNNVFELQSLESENKKYTIKITDKARLVLLTGKTPEDTLNKMLEFIGDKEGLEFYLNHPIKILKGNDKFKLAE